MILVHCLLLSMCQPAQGDQTRDQGGAVPLEPSTDWRAFRARLVAAESSEARDQRSDVGLQKVWQPPTQLQMGTTANF